MAAEYPGAVKNFLQLEDGVDTVLAQHPNERGDEITAIETELGTDVAGSTSDLKTRLAVSLNNNGTVKNLLGSWVDKSASYGAQQAATDGFVVGYFTGDDGSNVKAYTDINADPTTLRFWIDMGGSNINGMNFMLPVKKGDYWKLVVTVTTITVYWIPLAT